MDDRTRFSSICGICGKSLNHLILHGIATGDGWLHVVVEVYHGDGTFCTYRADDVKIIVDSK